jgi:hypothetical protein
VRHKRSHRKHKKAAHRKQTAVPSHSAPPDAPNLPSSPELAVGGASVETSSGGSSPGELIIGFGVLLGLLGAGIAYAPRAALPRGAAFRLEPHRQTILVTGAAIGIACILVGVLTGLMGP